MFSRILVSMLVLAVLPLALCACVSNSAGLFQSAAGPDLDAPGGISLPAPSTLHSAAFAPMDVRRLGKEYDHSLPSAHVSEDVFLAVFTPDWQAPNDVFGGLAYAIYSFNISDYNLDANLYVSCISTGDASNAWVGLANFTRDRWDWYQMPDSQFTPLAFSQAQHMTAAGGMYVVTLFTGADPWNVSFLRVGTIEQPVIGEVTPTTGVTGEQVTLHADISGTAPYDYYWYNITMGTPESSSTAEPVITLGEPGEYQYMLTVSNAAGSTNVTRTFNVLPAGAGAWQHSWGGNSSDKAYAATADSAGNIYVVGEAVGFGMATGAVTLKYTPAGVLQWIKLWDGISGENLQDIAINKDGDLVAVGSTQSTGAGQDDILILTYSPSGELLSQYTWGGAYQDTGESVAFDDAGNMYIAGNSSSFTSSNKIGVLLLKFNSSGGFNWATVWGGDSANETLYGMAVDSSGNSYLAGSSVTYSGQAFLLKFDSSGTILQQAGWESPLSGADYFEAVTLDGGDVYITGDTPDSGLGDPLVAKYNSALSLQWAKRWAGTDLDRGYGIASDGAGKIYVTGETWGRGPSANANLFLLQLGGSGALEHAYTWGIAAADGRGVSKIERGYAVAIGLSNEPVIAGVCENTYAVWQEETGTLTDIAGTEHMLDGEIIPNYLIGGTWSMPFGATDAIINSGYVEDTGVGSDNYAVIYGAPW